VSYQRLCQQVLLATLFKQHDRISRRFFGFYGLAFSEKDTGACFLKLSENVFIFETERDPSRTV
jgi:hypothetical protein